MHRFQRLCIASLGATFLLVAIGGLVRSTRSGLGCGDNWPDCPGDVTRALVIELSHRAAALAVIVLLGALAVVAIRERKLVGPSVAAFGLVLFQAVLGAIVVWLRLEAGSVVLHLGAALTLVGLLVYITARAYAWDGVLEARTDRSMARRASWAAAAVLMLVLLGSYVTGRGAGYVFPDWPLMDGRLVPDLGNELAAIHFLHRAGAALVGLLVGLVALDAIRRRAELPMQARLAHIAAGAYAVEVLMGAANVWSRLNPAFVTAHLLLGALVWAGFVAIAVVSRTLPQPEVAREGLARRRTQGQVA